MKIFVTVKPGAKQEKINPVLDRGAFKGGVKSADGTHVTVWVRAAAHEGKANEAVAKALAEHFGVALSRVRIASGHTSRKKIVEIT